MAARRFTRRVGDEKHERSRDDDGVDVGGRLCIYGQEYRALNPFDLEPCYAPDLLLERDSFESVVTAAGSATVTTTTTTATTTAAAAAAATSAAATTTFIGATTLVAENSEDAEDIIGTGGDEYEATRGGNDHRRRAAVLPRPTPTVRTYALFRLDRDHVPDLCPRCFSVVCICLL